MFRGCFVGDPKPEAAGFGLRLGWAALIVTLILTFWACGRKAPEYTVLENEGEFFELRLSDESTQPVHFYTYKLNGRNVNFFVRKDCEGNIRTHFDACYSCFKYKMGYVVEGNQVVCRACRIGYDLSEPIWDFVGACVPITLSSNASGGKVRIKVRNIKKGIQFF